MKAGFAMFLAPLLAILQVTSCARIAVHRQWSSSLAAINQTHAANSSIVALEGSRVGKDKIWENFDQYHYIEFFSNDKVQGTIRSGNGFRKMTMDKNYSPVFQFKSGAEMASFSFSQAFSKKDGSMLLFQGDGHELRNFDISFLQEMTQGPVAFTPVHLSFVAKVAGHSKAADWFGFLATQLSEEVHQMYFEKEGTRRVCHKFNPGANTRKMIVPLAYDSFQAAIEAGAQDDLPVEEFMQKSRRAPTGLVRLLSYRRGLFYMKYKCRKVAAKYSTDAEQQYLEVEKVSLILLHEKSPTYQILDVHSNEKEDHSGTTRVYGGIGPQKTGKTFHDSI